MEILRFPVQLESGKDGITVTFPDMPYGVTSANALGKNIIIGIE